MAACAVVALHARYFTAEPVNQSIARLGAAGVDLFFVISGFIMATIPKRSAGSFLFDRFWRVVPLWWIAVIPWLFALKPVLTPSIVTASITLWPVYDKFTPPALAVGWTLSFEMLFYFALALALVTRAVVPLSLFALALVAGIVIHAPIFDYLGNPMIFEFLFGVVIAQLPRREHWAWPLLVGSVLGFVISPLSLYPGAIATHAATSGLRAISWGMPAALAVYGCLCIERRFSSRLLLPLVFLGDASYSIYLFHKLAMFGLHGFATKLIVGIVGGIIAHLLIERPILRLKPTVRRSDRGAPPEAAPAIRTSTPGSPQPFADQPL